MLENIIGPKEKSDAGDIGNDAFFLCCQIYRLTESKPFEQGYHQQWEKYIVVDHGQEFEHFGLRRESYKIGWMNENQVEGHHHPYKKRMKHNGNDLR